MYGVSCGLVGLFCLFVEFVFVVVVFFCMF